MNKPIYVVAYYKSDVSGGDIVYVSHSKRQGFVVRAFKPRGVKAFMGVATRTYEKGDVGAVQLQGKVRVIGGSK